MNAETVVIDSKTGKPVDVPAVPVSLGGVAVKHLNAVGDGALVERVGKLMREGVRHIIEEEADKATVTITLTISKDKRDAQMFITEGKAVLKTPVPKYSNATFITQDGEPSNSQATLFLKKTDAFRKFRAYTQHPLGQRDFIKFLKIMDENITSHNSLELIALAENLKALKDVNSITKNAERGLSINVKVDSGIANIAVPEKITLQLPINEAMPDVKAEFEIECFYSFDDDTAGFRVELECYQNDQIVEDTTRATVKAIVERMGVKAYRI